MLRYAVTIFLGAFLLFLVQPLIGKYVLPWFGGGSGVWTACLLFFQCALLVGYLYAHVLVTALATRWQMIVHIALLLAGLAFLPIVPREALKPVDGSMPVVRIVTLLAATIGLPYLALSTTGPLLQAWFARTHPGRPPYRLYALSNAGSLLALLAYPFVVEPALPRKMQAYVWSGGFACFVVLCAWCAIAQARKRNNAETQKDGIDTRETGKRHAQTPRDDRSTASVDRVLWVLLPMCASMMLLAWTSLLSEEIAPMPFIWVLTLGIYLITFIIAFEWPRLYDRRVFAALAIAAPWLYVAVLVDTGASLFAQAAMCTVVLFIVCMICHGEVYRLRPQARDGQLMSGQVTGYYLAIALGGALGGAFVSIFAPLVFKSNVELYLAMFGSLALFLACLFRDPRSLFYRGTNRPAWLAVALVTVFAGFLIQQHLAYWHSNTTQQMRSFYGTLRVRLFEDAGWPWQYLKLEHGRIAHGAQALDPKMRHRPLMYYSPNSGVGLAMRVYPKKENRRVAVVGLGTGAMAAWGKPGDVFRFYEINPQVLQFAHNPFTYLDDSPAKVEVVMGDARLSMEREPPQHYDLIVLDAFSGDAVPTHLLTREAFQVYQRHLVDGGVIVVHITNRYLDLDPVVRRATDELGMSTVFVVGVAREFREPIASLWVLATKNPQMLASPEFIQAGVRPPGEATARLWTDDYSSILGALR